MGNVLFDTSKGDVTSITMGTVGTTPTTVALLPAASVVGAGAHAFVTDSTQTTTAGIGTTVVGGSTNKVPVYSDGSLWKIG